MNTPGARETKAGEKEELVRPQILLFRFALIHTPHSSTGNYEMCKPVQNDLQ